LTYIIPAPTTIIKKYIKVIVLILMIFFDNLPSNLIKKYEKNLSKNLENF